MADGRSVSYEVYYMQRGRWSIHARYKYDQRDEAIEECKRLDQQGFEGSCVVRESYSAASGDINESIIHHSPKLKGKPPLSLITGTPDASEKKSSDGGGAGPPKSGGGGGGSSRSAIQAPEGSVAANAAADAKKKREEEARRRAEEAAANPAAAIAAGPSGPPKQVVETEEVDLGRLLPRLILAFLIACIVGTVAAGICYYALVTAAKYRFVVGRGISEVIIIGSWVLGFLASFVPLFRTALSTSRYLVQREVDGHFGQAKPPSQSAGGSDVAAAAAELAKSASSAAAAAAEAGGGGDEQSSAVRRAALDALNSAKGAAFDFGSILGSGDENDDLDDDDEDEAPKTKKKGDDEKSANENVAGDPDNTLDPASLEPTLQRLVKEAISLSGAALASDHYLRFGLILFVAGAAESLGRRLRIDQQTLVKVLSGQIEELGASPAHAMGFAANIDEYLIEQRYFEMYAKGRAAGVKVGTDRKAPSGMPEAIAYWRTPKSSGSTADADAVQASAGDAGSGDVTNDQQAGASKSFVAVMFTDIADSTHKQQTMGDEWLMNVVRAHNDICREALAVYGGREIKHTGDGIMATFPTVTNSVEAGMAMQDGFKRFSSAMPDLAFRVRVGISAGEPIHESGDVFGTPVNLAARVLSKTEADEVWVSAIVHDMCQGKNFAFQEAGRFELKGFDTPQPIYKVIDRRGKSRGADASKAA